VEMEEVPFNRLHLLFQAQRSLICDGQFILLTRLNILKDLFSSTLSLFAIKAFKIYLRFSGFFHSSESRLLSKFKLSSQN
jgi:hypothetical protein